VPTDLAGRVALVTGASQGIGSAIAAALVAEGMRVWMVARSRESLERLTAEAGRGATAYPVDLTDRQARHDLLEALMQAEGRLDVLVNNAGVIHLGSTEEATEEQFAEQLAANVLAPYTLTQACLPMLRASRGEIVFVNSSAGKSANASMGQFSATQHAMRAVADALRAEVNADGVRVLVVYPGRTATPRQAAMHEAESRQYQPERLMQPSDVAEVIVCALRLPRTAEATEISLRPMLKTT
jgi:NADP-dependent 3-hydroxy acid dehydrogenase YdfG